MLKLINWEDCSIAQQKNYLKRPLQTVNSALKQQVGTILEQVKKEGDTACIELTKRFDQVDIFDLRVQAEQVLHAKNKVSLDFHQALKRVAQQLESFHSKQILTDYVVETSPGIRCELKARPIDKVGFYIPAGSAPLVSTVLMLAVPAKIANCQTRILCSPPNQNQQIDPHILVAADFCGIEQIYQVGGAQAIAAMAYGTETIPKVDKIFGPGNLWVTEAKLQAALDPEGAVCDLPAGPSEVMIIADKEANAAFIAADLLSQAEHGADSQVILISLDKDLALAVNEHIVKQIDSLARKEIALSALKNSCTILVSSILQAIEIANLYAPEHLILQIVNARNYIEAIKAAGSVFIGPWSPESAGDYASGTNHVLPTYGFAKSLSGLTVRDFMKSITFQELTFAGLCEIAPTILTLAEVEGLDAHAYAVKVRVKEAKA